MAAAGEQSRGPALNSPGVQRTARARRPPHQLPTPAVPSLKAPLFLRDVTFGEARSPATAPCP